MQENESNHGRPIVSVRGNGEINLRIFMFQVEVLEGHIWWEQTQNLEDYMACHHSISRHNFPYVK